MSVMFNLIIEKSKAERGLKNAEERAVSILVQAKKPSETEVQKAVREMRGELNDYN